MSTEVKVKVFNFNELSDEAKEKVRQKYRENGLLDQWWEQVYEDFQEICKAIGVELEERGRNEVCIWFRGFSSQGDGACFEGHYRYKKGCLKAIKGHAPLDTEIHKIVESLMEYQKTLRYRGVVRITQSGHYYHSNTMNFELDVSDCGFEVPDETYRQADEGISQCLKDLADWLYKSLEKEYDYLMSDEYIDETLTNNETPYLEDGREFVS